MKKFSAQHYPDPTKPPSGADNSETDNTQKCKTTQSFETLFDNETLSDVLLDINNGEYVFSAHKMILGMKSDVLAGMLNELVPVENQRPLLYLNEDNESAQVFSRFLYFIYSGSIWLHRDYVLPLYKLAAKYSVRPLTSHCENYVLQILNKTIDFSDTSGSFALDMVCSFCESNVASEQVRAKSFRVLCQCFQDLVCSMRWSRCSWQLVRDLLESDDCHADENSILTAATDWMKKNKLQEKSKIEDILSNIRYPLLNQRVLYHLMKNGAFQNFPYVAELVNNAVKYHCFKDLPEARHEFNGVQYQPRRAQLSTSVPMVCQTTHKQTL